MIISAANIIGMKHSIIIYGSRYGSTKRYAERLAEKTGIKAVAFKEAKDLSAYDRVIYMGALYAGTVMGLKKTVGRMQPRQELIVVTVGLTAPDDPTNIAKIRQSIKARIPSHFYDEGRIYHLRGGIDFTQLGVKHRVMLSFVHSRVSKMPEAELDAEARAMLETYGKVVDFVDENALLPIISNL